MARNLLTPCGSIKDRLSMDDASDMTRALRPVVDELNRLGVPFAANRASIPVQQPFGGHAIFVDARKFLPKVPREQFQAQTLAVELYLEGGVRGVEIGTLMADRDPETRENRYPKLELMRLAIPRRVYTNNHMDYVAACLKNIWDRHQEINRGLRIKCESPILRHFTVELEKF